MTSFQQRLAAIAVFGLAAPSLALAQTSPGPVQSRAAAQACRPDYERFCANVQPGGGRIVACLKPHFAELSPSCTQALVKARAAKANGAATPK